MKSVLLSSGSRPAHGRSRTPGLGTPWSPADGSWGWRGTGHGADTFLWVAEGLTPFPLAELRAGRASSPCAPGSTDPQGRTCSNRWHILGRAPEQPQEPGMDKRIPCHISPSTSLPPLCHPSLPSGTKSWDLGSARKRSSLQGIFWNGSTESCVGFSAPQKPRGGTGRALDTCAWLILRHQLQTHLCLLPTGSLSSQTPDSCTSGVLSSQTHLCLLPTGFLSSQTPVSCSPVPSDHSPGK